jgi:uncharacterized protein with HEPN domain
VPFDDPIGRLEDILEAAARIQRYAGGLSLAAFEADEKTVDAVVRNFIVIGEASNHVSPDIMERNPNVPWHQMRGLRNIAVHEYARVVNRIIWEAVTLHLPPLIPLLRDIIEREQ